VDQKNIKNFAIIAHIDHGKSTLADRIMEICGAIPEKHEEQILDSLELEREHGITIKLKAIRLNYQLSTPQSGSTINYQLNLLDTPGHVDFSYEVSRSLASVEGALLTQHKEFRLKPFPILTWQLMLNCQSFPLSTKLTCLLQILSRQLRNLWI